VRKRSHRREIADAKATSNSHRSEFSEVHKSLVFQSLTYRTTLKSRPTFPRDKF
jgi:hypothetical protein